MNQQGPDVGSQYRSIIFYHTEEQKKLATEMKDQLNSIVKEKFKKEIVTWIKPISNFYRAEEYHQRYLTKFS